MVIEFVKLASFLRNALVDRSYGLFEKLDVWSRFQKWTHIQKLWNTLKQGTHQQNQRNKFHCLQAMNYVSKTVRNDVPKKQFRERILILTKRTKMTSDVY